MIRPPRASVRLISTNCLSAMPSRATGVSTLRCGARVRRISAAAVRWRPRGTTPTAGVWPRKMFCATSELRDEAQFLTNETDTERQSVARPLDLDGARGWSISIVPASGGTIPNITFIKVDLPAPFSPRRAWTSPLSQREVHPVQHADPAEGLGDAPHQEHRRAVALPFPCCARRSWRVAYWADWSIYLATLSLVRTAAGETIHGGIV